MAHRKDFAELHEGDKILLMHAFNRLHHDGVIEGNRANHASFGSRIHWVSAFLPWHRWFLRELEKKFKP